VTLIAIVALGSVVDQRTATMRMIGIGLPNRETLLQLDLWQMCNLDFGNVCGGHKASGKCEKFDSTVSLGKKLEAGQRYLFQSGRLTCPSENGLNTKKSLMSVLYWSRR
jgi:hypothetical protein